MSVVKRLIFPESFKREAVDRVATSGLSAGAVARQADDVVLDQIDPDRTAKDRFQGLVPLCVS